MRDMQPAGRLAVTFIKETPNREELHRNRDGPGFFLAVSSSESMFFFVTSITTSLLEAALEKIFPLCFSREKKHDLQDVNGAGSTGCSRINPVHRHWESGP